MTTTKIDRQSAVDSAALWLTSLGLPSDVAQVVVSHMADADLVGRRSHGFRLLPALARSITRSTPMPDDVAVTEREPGTIVIDGAGLPGIFTMWRATDELLRGHRVGRRMMAAGVVEISGTTGCLGLYAHRLAMAGVTGLVMVTSPPIMAPPGGVRPLLGTNAIAFAAPSAGEVPIVGDFASSEWAYGDIALARDRGEAVPLGVLRDGEGNATTDPSAIVDGTLVPSGGRRGWCQALLVEVLAGALIGGKVGQGPGRESALILSFLPDAFAAPGGLDEGIGQLVTQICSSEALPGQPRPRVPGGRFERLGGSRTQVDVDVATLRRIESMGGPALDSMA